MVEIKFKTTFSNEDDWLALYFKEAPSGVLSCPPDECTANGWIGVDLIAGEGTANLEAGTYFVRYEARQTPGEAIQLQILQDSAVLFDINITIDSGGITTGCNVFEVWV